jgi:hypothetical protein
MRGGGGVAGSQPMSIAVHITWHRAQINFGDLPTGTEICFFKMVDELKNKRIPITMVWAQYLTFAIFPAFLSSFFLVTATTLKIMWIVYRVKWMDGYLSVRSLVSWAIYWSWISPLSVAVKTCITKGWILTYSLIFYHADMHWSPAPGCFIFSININFLNVIHPKKKNLIST